MLCAGPDMMALAVLIICYMGLREEGGRGKDSLH